MTSSNRRAWHLSTVILVVSFVMISVAAFAANPWDQAENADPQAILAAAKAIPVGKDADVDIFLMERRYVFDEQGNVTLTSKWVYRVNTNDGVKNWSEVSAIWEPWHQNKPEINVRVTTPDGVVHVLDPKTLVDAPARNNQESTYDDDRKYHGPMPAVAVGAIVEEQVVMRDTSPFFEGGAVRRSWVGSSMPLQQARLIIEVPASTPLRYTLSELPNATVKKDQVDGKTRVTIEHGPMEALKRRDANLPFDVSRWPHVDFTTAVSWQDVAKRYSKAVEEQIRPAEVKDFLPEKTPGATRQQIIQAIVSKLHKEVRYTGIEFGRSKLVPQNPAEVLKRKYGDCKDKATLLVTMLRASGIPANVVLLTADDSQDVAEDMPGLNLFNHAIVFVPGSKNTPDLWIDATAQYTPVGTLPAMDQGRMVLVVADQTKSLVKTPETKSKDNVYVETREFFLAENGPSRVVETTQCTGNSGAYFRYLYEKITDERRKNVENYVKSAYLAESLKSIEPSGVDDVTKPFTLRLEVEKARRGNTGQQDAAVALWPSALLNNLPPSLRQPEDEEKDEKSPKKPLRKDDFQLHEAFTYEMRYRIVPPPGFQVHGLPENKTIAIGPAKLSQEFKTEKDGVVTGIIRFDSVKRRYTLAEGKEIQEAVQKAQKAPATLITFDSTGYVLLKAGKIRESLAAYRDLIALHPKEGLHHVQLADVLLQAGLGETARTEARLGTTLDPTSAPAFRSLGWILQHDLVGRRFERGFDLEGSIAAYRKAVELDPKSDDTKLDFAILLEHDKEGSRYAEGAKLDEAITQYREVRNRDPKKLNTEYDNNLLYSLLYAKRYKEAQELAAEMAPSESRNAVLVAAIACAEGTDKAIEESGRASQNENERNQALYSGGTLLARMRMYPEALKLMTTGAASQTNSPEILGTIESVRNAKKIEEIPHSTKTPEDVARGAILALLVGADMKEVLGISSKNSRDNGKTEEEQFKEYDKSRRQFRTALSNGEWPILVAEDMTFSNLKVYKTGDDATGYDVTMELMGGSPEHMFVVKEDGEYKVLSSAGKDMADTGREALARVRAGDVRGARRVLDWTREQSKPGDGNDPLDGPVFRRFWTRGQNAEKEAIEFAAASLMVTDKSAKRAIPILEQGRAKAASDSDRLKFDLALSAAYLQMKQWPELMQSSERLLKAEPLSDSALRSYAVACWKTKNWAAINKALQERLQKIPDDAVVDRLLAQTEAMQSHFEKYREIHKKLIDSGKAESEDMNGYTWAALFMGKVDSDDIEFARRGLSKENNRSYAIMHTLACLYAEVGKTKEARDLLVKAMEVANMDEPDESVWYGFGRIAEQYGEYEAARDAYKRVETKDSAEEADDPFATVNLMKLRMKVVEAELKKSGQTAAAK